MFPRKQLTFVLLKASEGGAGEESLGQLTQTLDHGIVVIIHILQLLLQSSKDIITM